MEKKDMTLQKYITEHILQLRRVNFEEEAVNYYMKQLAKAKKMLLEKTVKMVEIRHRGKKGYLHSDIKGDNIVVETNNYRIMDIYYIDFANIGPTKNPSEDIKDVEIEIEDMFEFYMDLESEKPSSDSE